MPGFSLVSVNIERSKHVDRVIPFLKSRNADVVCMQELMEYDIARFEQELGMRSFFAPMTMQIAAYLGAEEKPGISGIGLFSRAPVTIDAKVYYAGNGGVIVPFDPTDMHTKQKTESYALLHAQCEKEGATYHIATTHFTWTPDGAPSDYQRKDSDVLLAELKKIEPFVLVGDFNAPRPGEIFTKIASHYKDNIPLHYKTSIDASLHRNGTIRPNDFVDKMVDGLFTTPEYSAFDVELHAGVSDHMAVTATIAKNA